MSNKPQLPKEVAEKIENESTAYANERFGDINTIPIEEVSHWDYAATAWEKGAMAYATKLHEAQQEVTRLTNWQQEAKRLLNPIWDYADTLNVPLGESKTEAVIKHVNEAKELLEETLSDWDSMVFEQNLKDKIKRFLYGE